MLCEYMHVRGIYYKGKSVDLFSVVSVAHRFVAAGLCAFFYFGQVQCRSEVVSHGLSPYV